MRESWHWNSRHPKGGVDSGAATTPARALPVLLSFDAIPSFIHTFTHLFTQQTVLASCCGSGQTPEPDVAEIPVCRCSHSGTILRPGKGSGNMFPDSRPWPCRPCCAWLSCWPVPSPLVPSVTHLCSPCSLSIAWGPGPCTSLMRPLLSPWEPRAAPSESRAGPASFVSPPPAVPVHR